MKGSLFLRILIMACTLLPACAAAQGTPRTDGYGHSLAVQPLYIFNQGVRVDYERQLSSPYHWLQVSGKGYYMHRADDAGLLTLLFGDDRIETLSGAGAELNYKYFFLKRRHLYVSAGLSYGYVHTKLHGVDFSGFREDDLTLYRPHYRLQSQDFNRAGFNTFFGIQTSPYRRFFVDVYAGVGYARSFYDRSRYYPDTGNMNGLSYSGPTVTAGVRIGIRF